LSLFKNAPEGTKNKVQRAAKVPDTTDRRPKKRYIYIYIYMFKKLRKSLNKSAEKVARRQRQQKLLIGSGGLTTKDNELKMP